MSLENKVIAVLGASSGIGEGIARAVAALKPKGLVIAARRAEFLETLATELRDANDVNVLPIPTDATDSEQLRRFIDQTIETYGQIDTVINSAGLIQAETPIHEVDPDYRRRITELNYHIPLDLAGKLVPIFRERGVGTYVVISSQAGQPDRAFPGEAEYCGSKAAIDQAMRAVDRELIADRAKGRGLYVFTLSPGLINTEEARKQLPDIPEGVWEKAPNAVEFAETHVIPYIESPDVRYGMGREFRDDAGNVVAYDTAHFIETVTG